MNFNWLRNLDRIIGGSTASKLYNIILFAGLIYGLKWTHHQILTRIENVHSTIFTDQKSNSRLTYDLDKGTVVVISNVDVKSLKYTSSHFEKLSSPIWSAPLKFEIHHHFGIEGYEAVIFLRQSNNSILKEYGTKELVFNLTKDQDIIELKIDELNLKNLKETIYINSLTVMFNKSKFINLNADYIAFRDYEVNFKLRNVSIAETSQPNKYILSVKKVRNGHMSFENLLMIMNQEKKDKITYSFSGAYNHLAFKASLTKEDTSYYASGKIPKAMFNDYVTIGFDGEWEKLSSNTNQKNRLKALQLKMNKNASFINYRKNILNKYIPPRFMKEIEHYFVFEIPKEHMIPSTYMTKTPFEVLLEWKKLPFEDRIETAFYQCSINYRDPIYCSAARKLYQQIDESKKALPNVMALEARFYLARLANTLNDDKPVFHASGMKRAQNLIREIKSIDLDNKFVRILNFDIESSKGRPKQAKLEIQDFLSLEKNPQIKAYYTIMASEVNVRKKAELIRKAIALNPKSYIGLALVGLKAQLHKNNKEYSAYEMEMDMLVEKTQTHPWLFINYAKYLDQNNRLEKAVKVLLQCLENLNNKRCLQYYESYQYAMTQKKLVQKQYDVALEDFNTMLSINPLYPKAYFGKGIIHHINNEFAEALNSYLMACGLGVANACIQVGDWNMKNSVEEATPFYKIACSLNSSSGCQKAGITVSNKELSE